MPVGVLHLRRPCYSGIVSLALAVFVSATLVLGPAPARPPARFQELEAHVHELAGQKRYRELALAGAAGFERHDLEPYQRREMAFFAIRGLHGVFEETGEVSKLCDAGRLMRRVQAEVGFAEDADAAARLTKATEKHLARTGVSDPCPRKKPVRTSQALAARPSAPATVVPPTEHPANSGPPATRELAAEDVLLAVPALGARVKDVPKSMSVKPDAPAPAQRPARAVLPARDEARSMKLTHGGLALLALGAAGSVALGLTLHYRGRASATIDALRATADMRGASTPEEYAQARELNQSYRQLTIAAGVGGTLAVAGVVGAVTLFALRARRPTTLAGPWIGPGGAGLSIRGRF